MHLDIEPHTTDAWDDGDSTVKRSQLQELATTYTAVRTLLDAGGQTDVKIYADNPVWYDSSAKIAWTDVDRDQWFADISVPLDGLTLMAYERSSFSSIISGVTYEANNFAGEVRVGLNNKEIGPGDTFEDFGAYTSMIDAVDGADLPLGGLDHHTFYLLAEFSPDPLITADFNTDGDVDGDDYLALQRGYGLDSLAELSDGDADGNEAVNVFDFLAWEVQCGAPSPELTAVPEPSALVSLLVAVSIVLFFRCSLLYRVWYDGGLHEFG